MGGLRTARHGTVDVLAGREGVQYWPCVTNGAHVPQVCVPRHLAVVVASVVTGTTGWLRSGCLIELKRNFLDEVICSYQRPAYYHSYTTVYNLRMNVLYCFMSPRNFI